MAIIMACQKVKNNVILIVKNLRRGEYGARGLCKAW